MGYVCGAIFLSLFDVHPFSFLCKGVLEFCILLVWIVHFLEEMGYIDWLTFEPYIQG